MAGTSGARQFTEADKAQALVTLVANGGNVKRTSKDTGFAPATIRRWRDRQAQATGQAAASPGALAVAATSFTADLKRTRDKALTLLEERIDEGDIKTSELITAVGVLDDKITRAEPMEHHVEHTLALPSPDEVRGLLGPFLEAGLANAARRHEEIVEAEVVRELPAGD
jgi:transposase-like protein